MQALSRMPFTRDQIDRSFVAAAASDPKYRLMVEHTIAVAHQLGLRPSPKAWKRAPNAICW
jgi:EAL domain-containing protein (putative c-di-GMP-specific phosphodiesterase class I)